MQYDATYSYDSTSVTYRKQKRGDGFCAKGTYVSIMFLPMDKFVIKVYYVQ